MRVYNGTNSQVDLPLSGSQRISISSHSVSGDIMPSTEFLSLLVSSYDYSELALIVSGPFEINLCAGVSGCVGFVCQSLEEAIERFTPKNTDELDTPKETGIDEVEDKDSSLNMEEVKVDPVNNSEISTNEDMDKKCSEEDYCRDRKVKKPKTKKVED